MQSSEHSVGIPSLGEIYDSLFATKRYSLEVSSLVSHFGKGWRSGLDVGCGTGSHTFEFARQGLFMVGIDRDPKMIAAANIKPSLEDSLGSRTKFYSTDFPNFQSYRVDFVSALFNVINYYLTEDELIGFFLGVRNSAPEAVLCLDMWDSETVRADPPIKEERPFTIRGLPAQLEIEPVMSPDLCFCVMKRTVFWGKSIVDLTALHQEHIWHRIWTSTEIEIAAATGGFHEVSFYDWHALGGDSLKSRRRVLLAKP
jgi:SAM-dependent methyltransferase